MDSIIRNMIIHGNDIKSYLLYETYRRILPFYRDKMLCLDAKPNVTHQKLAELEAAGKVKAVITQNIDGLHQMAGSRRVLELHGSVHRNYCQKCGKGFDAEYILKSGTEIPLCDACGGKIKPDVVLYEEGLNQQTLEDAVFYISHADVLIIGGTSLAVYPAAGLIDYYRETSWCLSINLQHRWMAEQIF